MSKQTNKAATKKDRNEGEGNYTAAREFDRDQENFVKAHKGDIERMGKDAEKALDGDEGKSLRDAEEKAKAKARR